MHSGGGASSSFRVFGSCSFASPVVSVLSLISLFSPFFLPSPGSLFPSGVVPGLSGRKLVQDFQRHLHIPSLFVCCAVLLLLLFPLITSLQKVSQCGTSGRRLVRLSLHWFPQPFQSGTVSGRRLVQSCCFPYRFMELLDSKQRKPGSN